MLCGPSCCQLGTDVVQQLSDLAHLQCICWSFQGLSVAPGVWSGAEISVLSAEDAWAGGRLVSAGDGPILVLLSLPGVVFLWWSGVLGGPLVQTGVSCGGVALVHGVF